MATIQVYDGLVMRNPEMEIVPGLAVSWTNIDPNTWEFRLRENVRFHDGSDFDADDVIFSINRALSETSQMQGYLNSIETVKKVDDHTVRLITKGPNPILLDQLVNVFMMDKEWSEEHGVERPQNFKDQEETFAVRNANGTGAFKLESREPDIETVYVRNPDWWGSETYDHNIDRVVWRPISNLATRVAALLSNEVDLVIDPPLQDLARIDNYPELNVLSTSQIRTIFLGLDVGRDELRNSSVTGENPFQDVRVREAIYRAINIIAIREKIMRGLSMPAGMLIEPPINGYNADWDNNRLEYDPERAAELLQEAGYPDGFTVRLDCPNDRYINDEAICQAVVGMLGRIGIQVNLNSQPKSKHFPLITGRDTDFYMLGWGIPTMDSGFIFDYLFHSDGSWNASGYGTPQLNAKIEKIRSVIDKEERDLLIAEIWEQIVAEMPYIPLHHQMVTWAASSDLNIPVEPNNMPRFYWANFN
ncbi:MAG: ABC transporter substrate-binding protein [Roseibium sp.]|uniref:ABC transporter substrate-binding protein n=1 Tax=Roseibium sp. TaxID=1936156 RepID=UPI00260664E1|nr:ABC transporter substrate-binding protein [Roseibium sp.]MCV0425891.1 ABC transporter substrate-binding protein [Roseibium sp.]